jgi:TPR repeat protein
MKKIIPLLALLMVVGMNTAIGADADAKLQELRTVAPPVKQSIEEIAAQFKIGQTHYYNKEYAEAYKIWKLAADANILEAYNNLGYHTYYGLGVEQNPQEGIRLWQIAANNGFAESQIHLSDAYFDGYVFPKDLIEAYAWAKAAAYFADMVGDNELRKTFKHDSKKLIEKYSKKLSWNTAKQAEDRAQSLIATISETIKTTPYIRLFSIPKSKSPTLPVPNRVRGEK